jgi:phosphate transport system protein
LIRGCRGYTRIVPHDLRPSFHNTLDDLDEHIGVLFDFVADSVVKVSTSVSTGNSELAHDVLARETLLDSHLVQLEESLPTLFARQQPVARDLRLLITAMRVLPELERSHDLASHLAHRWDVRMGDLPPVASDAVHTMGMLAGQMWVDAAASYHDRDPSAAAHLERRDDDLDAVVASLRAGLVVTHVEAASVLNAVLVGRFFERLGDHAVHLAAHVAYLVTGESGIPTLPA